MVNSNHELKQRRRNSSGGSSRRKTSAQQTEPLSLSSPSATLSASISDKAAKSLVETNQECSSSCIWSFWGICVGSGLGLGTTTLIHRHTPTKTLLLRQVWKPVIATLDSIQFRNPESPAILFRSCLVALLATVFVVKILQRILQSHTNDDDDDYEQGSAEQESTTTTASQHKHRQQLRWLQGTYLIVFWLYRVTFWMSGPYFYAAYASKPNATVRTISTISLTGYGAIALLGPATERLVTTWLGKKWGAVVGAIGYGLGNLSVAYDDRLWVLLLGRAVGGIGQSLVGTCAEAWLMAQVRHHQEMGVLDKTQHHGKQTNETSASRQFLGETFGWGFSWDSAIAVVAGQLAGWSANRGGPTAPCGESPFFLVLSIIVIILTWSDPTTLTTTRKPSIVLEHSTATPKRRQSSKTGSLLSKTQPTIRDTLKIIARSPRIMAVGIAQATFESAMYIWVLSWSPVMKRAIHATFGEGPIPYGTAFSCFMAACMLGSTAMQLVPLVNLERVAAVLYACASVSLLYSITVQRDIPSDEGQGGGVLSILKLFSCYLVFEAAVGMYFPLMCTIRSSALPDTHRSVIMSLFAVPLNAIIVSVCLSLTYLGHAGAMQVAATLLGIGALAMIFLDHLARQERAAELRHRFRITVKRAMAVNTIETGTKRRQSSLLESIEEIEDDELYEEMRRRRSSTWNY